MQTLTNMCTIYDSELFPTVVRNSILSTASSAARLGAIVAPLVAEIDESRPALPILLYGLMALVAGIQVREILLYKLTLPKVITLCACLNLNGDFNFRVTCCGPKPSS